jgi:hypothetical protein
LTQKGGVEIVVGLCGLSKEAEDVTIKVFNFWREGFGSGLGACRIFPTLFEN